MRMDCCELTLDCGQYMLCAPSWLLDILCKFAVLSQKATLDNFNVVGRRLSSSHRRLVQARHERRIGMSRVRIVYKSMVMVARDDLGRVSFVVSVWSSS